MLLDHSVTKFSDKKPESVNMQAYYTRVVTFPPLSGNSGTQRCFQTESTGNNHLIVLHI